MSDPILDLLQRFPNCRVTIRSGTSRPKPRVGDRRFFKTKGGWHVRRRQTYQGMDLSRNGRPAYEWVKEVA